MKTRTKELWIFLLITYGVNIVLILLKIEIDRGYMMLYPATGVAIARYQQKEYKIMHQLIIACFMIYTVIFILLQMSIINHSTFDTLGSIVILGGGGAIFWGVWITNNEAMYPWKNQKWAKKTIAFFISLYTGVYLIYVLICGGNAVSFLMSIAGSLVGFFFTVMLFIGEEYGWRGFLQGELQERIGKRRGVIVLGIVWGLWHTPIWFDINELAVVDVLTAYLQIIAISIFIGYAYMKTENIWVCAFLHQFHNLVHSSITSAIPNYEETFINSVISWIALFVVNGSLATFILKKEYSSKHIQEES